MKEKKKERINKAISHFRFAGKVGVIGIGVTQQKRFSALLAITAYLMWDITNTVKIYGPPTWLREMAAKRRG